MHDTKNTTRRVFASIGLAAALALGLGSAYAQQATAPQGGAAQATPGSAPQVGTQGAAMGQRSRSTRYGQPMPELNMRDVHDRVEAAGYREVREIEWDKGRWKVKALDAEGSPVTLYVNGSSGDVEHIKRKGNGPRWSD